MCDADGYTPGQPPPELAEMSAEELVELIRKYNKEIAVAQSARGWVSHALIVAQDAAANIRHNERILKDLVGDDRTLEKCVDGLPLEFAIQLLKNYEVVVDTSIAQRIPWARWVFVGGKWFKEKFE